MLIPIRTCSLYNQSPLPNWGIIATTVLAFAACLAGDVGWAHSLVLRDASPSGMLGHMFLHGGILHLAGNMVFLWVFGNAVCAKTGPVYYIPVYLLCGIGGAASHLLFSTGSAIGASGAINGIIAFYLVLQPVNDVEMLLVFFRIGRRFTIAGFWVILYWLAWDVFGALRPGMSNVGFAAHLGGFGTGFLLGFLFVYLKQVTMDEYDNPTLPEYLGLLPKGYSSPSRKDCGSKARGELRHHAAAPRRPPPPPPERPAAEGVPVASARTTTFPCPHCQASLELDLDALPAAGSLSCPACKGTIELVVE